MQKIVQIIFLMFVFHQVIAQVSYSPVPIEVVADPNETENIQTDFELKNEGQDTLRLAWTLDVIGQPEQWQYYVCDTEICYNLGDQVSNTEKPNILYPESSIIVMFHTLPAQTEGEGSYEISFFDVSNPDSILLVVPIKVNTNTSTSTKENLLNGLSIFPNPAQDYFRINTGNRIQRIDILDIVGKKTKSFKATQGKYYDISDLQSGFYYIRLIDRKSEVVKVLKLNKS